jgi:hypothetical protein
MVFMPGSLQARETKPSLLHRLEIPQGKLPQGCTPESLPADLPPGKKITNPGTTSDAEIIKKLDLGSLLEATPKEMFFSVYQYQKEKSEVGVFGWEFANAAGAEKLFNKLNLEYKSDSNFQFWRQGLSVVLLWRDPGEASPCWDPLKTHLQQVVKAD